MERAFFFLYMFLGEEHVAEISSIYLSNVMEKHECPDQIPHMSYINNLMDKMNGFELRPRAGCVDGSQISCWGSSVGARCDM